jgi:hypothetical protein
MISSARASSDCVRVRPSIFAVLARVRVADVGREEFEEAHASTLAGDHLPQRRR